MTAQVDTPTRPAAEAPPRPRMLFLDNLRLGLVALVVMHHVAMTYGAAGLFYYVEFHPSGFSRGLLIFALANQAWFMGAFFLVAGYLTPGSLSRKGQVVFLRDRLLRLGIPLAVYMLLLNPLTLFGSFFLPDSLGRLTWDTYRYTDYVRMGPMWFVALLLIFSFAYAGWRLLAGNRVPVASGEPSAPGYMAVGAFVVALAGAGFLMRMLIAVGESEFGFPSLGYLPQYAGFFVLGVLAYRRDWLGAIPASMGISGLAAAAAASVFLFPLAFSGRMFSLELSETLSKAMGDGYWQSAVYAAWDATVAVGLSIALIVAIREFLDRQGRLARSLALHSYTVYVIHIPIVVFVAVALKELDMPHLLKFGLAGAIAIPVCFTTAHLVRRLPFASRIL